MTPEDRFEQWLRAQYEREPEPVDDGFTLRVMAALPPQPAAVSKTGEALRYRSPNGGWSKVNRVGWGRAWREGQRRRRLLAQSGEVAAMACAGLALSALSVSGLADAEVLLASACLLGLLLWWSLPQSTGSLWR